MKAFFKGLAILLGLFIGAATAAAVSPQIGLVIGSALLIVPMIALFKPLPSIGLGHRGYSIAVGLIVGLPATFASVGLINDQDINRLTELKEANPAAYLSELRTNNEGRWLEELAELDPDQHTIEIARIAEETAQSEEKERLASEVAQRAEVTAHIEQLDREIASMPGVRASNYTESVDQINIALILIGTWNLLYEEGASFSLDTDSQQKRQRFRELLIRKQIEMFPTLRDAYAPAMRQQLWEADGSARTIGSGYRTVEFVSAAFARNANIKQIHTEIYENLMMLRFTRAQYKWISQASEFSYYTLEPPKDSDLGMWGNGGRFRTLN